MMELALCYPKNLLEKRKKCLSELNPQFGGNRFTEWLRRKLWKFVGYGYYWIAETRTEYGQVQFEKGSIINAVVKSQYDIRRVFNGEAKYLIVGGDHYGLLMRERIGTSFSIYDECRIGWGDEVRLCGMTVVYVPWVEGVAILPEINQVSKPRGIHEQYR